MAPAVWLLVNGEETTIPAQPNGGWLPSTNGWRTVASGMMRGTKEGSSAVLSDLYPLGEIIDEGDTVLQMRRLVKGRRATVVFHWGESVDTDPAHRIPSGNQTPAPRKATTIMDLHADKSRTLTPKFGDEFGNPASDGASSQTLVSDNEALVTATDNGDGSFTVAAVGGLGNLGVANLTYNATLSNGATLERVEAVNVIAGGAETVTFEFGAEVETTPDTPPPAPEPAPEPTP